MSAPLIRDLPYRADSSLLFGPLVTRQWPVFLDSGRPGCDQGRFDILSADPRVRILTRGLETEIHSDAGRRLSTADPFDLLAETLEPLRSAPAALPFLGGAIGYFGYDLSRRLESLPSLAQDAENIPDMAVGIYDWALVVDHWKRRSHLVGVDGRRLERYAGLFAGVLAGRPADAGQRPFRVVGEVRSNMSRDRYLSALARIERYLRAGDCYQINLAQRFAAPAEGDPWQAYKLLRRLNPAPFGAYLDIGECQVLSSSPERFLRVGEEGVETRPIKGTLRRGADPAEDRRLAETLRKSPKDRAENLMIVDLLRNDLGKVCEIGSVHVPSLFAIESFARVHHLVSTVSGRLAQGRGALDLLRACFPGGSITGAPKRRAMEIIEELEPHRRGLYCGAIGYIGFDGAMDTNIAIRTLVNSAGLARFWAGGGIVIDSDPESEYRETYDKAAALLDLLERLRSGPLEG
ncbi:aminodeoxychorismate synthase component I [Imhoffiella purpurea]|nr:aminodeoxychorismate synthase component I [Imhoffiella purpurea]